MTRKLEMCVLDGVNVCSITSSVCESFQEVRYTEFVDGDYLWGLPGGRETVRTRSPGSVFSRWHTFLNPSIFYVIYDVLSSGGFTVSCLQTIVNGVPDSRYPGQTRVLFKFRQPDVLFHTLKTVKGLIHLVPSRTPRTSGYGVLFTCLIYIGVHPHKYIGYEDNVQTGGVLRVRYMWFDVHLCNHIIPLQSGGGT